MSLKHDKRTYEADFNGDTLPDETQKRIDIKPSQKFIEFLAGSSEQKGGLVEAFFDACFNDYDGEVNMMVQELVKQHPELNTPLARFNAGQAFLTRLTGIFQQMLNDRLADYLNYATVEFVGITKSREAKELIRQRQTGAGGIG